MSHIHFGLKKSGGEPGAISQTLKSRNKTGATIGSKSKGTSTEKASRKSKGSKSTTPKKDLLYLIKNGLKEIEGDQKTKYLRVWKLKEPPYQVGVDGFLNKDLKKDYDGWVDAKLFLPLAFDLVYMRLERRTIPGWWNGNFWEGMRLLETDCVLYWKYKKDEDGPWTKE